MNVVVAFLNKFYNESKNSKKIGDINIDTIR
jgi:hypothetical protein